MKNNRWIALALIAAMAVCLFGCGAPASQETTAAQGKTFTVTVVHADKTSKEFTFTSKKEYVGQALLAEKLVSGSNGAYGLYIETVDGEEAIYAESGAYWSFYIGDEYAQTGVDRTPIEDGAAYRLVYEVYEG